MVPQDEEQGEEEQAGRGQAKSSKCEGAVCASVCRSRCSPAKGSEALDCQSLAAKVNEGK